MMCFLNNCMILLLWVCHEIMCIGHCVHTRIAGITSLKCFKKNFKILKILTRLNPINIVIHFIKVWFDLILWKNIAITKLNQIDYTFDLFLCFWSLMTKFRYIKYWEVENCGFKFSLLYIIYLSQVFYHLSFTNSTAPYLACIYF